MSIQSDSRTNHPFITDNHSIPNALDLNLDHGPKNLLNSQTRNRRFHDLFTTNRFTTELQDQFISGSERQIWNVFNANFIDGIDLSYKKICSTFQRQNKSRSEFEFYGNSVHQILGKSYIHNLFLFLNLSDELKMIPTDMDNFIKSKPSIFMGRLILSPYDWTLDSAYKTLNNTISATNCTTARMFKDEHNNEIRLGIVDKDSGHKFQLFIVFQNNNPSPISTERVGLKISSPYNRYSDWRPSDPEAWCRYWKREITTYGELNQRSWIKVQTHIATDGAISVGPLNRVGLSTNSSNIISQIFSLIPHPTPSTKFAIKFQCALADPANKDKYLSLREEKFNTLSPYTESLARLAYSDRFPSDQLESWLRVFAEINPGCFLWDGDKARVTVEENLSHPSVLLSMSFDEAIKTLSPLPFGLDKRSLGVIQRFIPDESLEIRDPEKYLTFALNLWRSTHFALKVFGLRLFDIIASKRNIYPGLNKNELIVIGFMVKKLSENNNLSQFSLILTKILHTILAPHAPKPEAPFGFTHTLDKESKLTAHQRLYLDLIESGNPGYITWLMEQIDTISFDEKEFHTQVISLLSTKFPSRAKERVKVMSESLSPNDFENTSPKEIWNFLAVFSTRDKSIKRHCDLLKFMAKQLAQQPKANHDVTENSARILSTVLDQLDQETRSTIEHLVGDYALRNFINDLYFPALINDPLSYYLKEAKAYAAKFITHHLDRPLESIESGKTKWVLVNLIKKIGIPTGYKLSLSSRKTKEIESLVTIFIEGGVLNETIITDIINICTKDPRQNIRVIENLSNHLITSSKKYTISQPTFLKLFLSCTKEQQKKIVRTLKDKEGIAHILFKDSCSVPESDELLNNVIPIVLEEALKRKKPLIVNETVENSIRSTWETSDSHSNPNEIDFLKYFFRCPDQKIRDLCVQRAIALFYGPTKKGGTQDLLSLVDFLANNNSQDFTIELESIICPRHMSEEQALECLAPLFKSSSQNANFVGFKLLMVKFENRTAVDKHRKTISSLLRPLLQKFTTLSLNKVERRQIITFWQYTYDNNLKTRFLNFPEVEVSLVLKMIDDTLREKSFDEIKDLVKICTPLLKIWEKTTDVKQFLKTFPNNSIGYKKMGLLFSAISVFSVVVNDHSKIQPHSEFFTILFGMSNIMEISKEAISFMLSIPIKSIKEVKIMRESLDCALMNYFTELDKQQIRCSKSYDTMHDYLLAVDYPPSEDRPKKDASKVEQSLWHVDQLMWSHVTDLNLRFTLGWLYNRITYLINNASGIKSKVISLILNYFIYSYSVDPLTKGKYYEYFKGITKFRELLIELATKNNIFDQNSEYTQYVLDSLAQESFSESIPLDDQPQILYLILYYLKDYSFTPKTASVLKKIIVPGWKETRLQINEKFSTLPRPITKEQIDLCEDTVKDFWKYFERSIAEAIRYSEDSNHSSLNILETLGECLIEISGIIDPNKQRRVASNARMIRNELVECESTNQSVIDELDRIINLK